MTGEQAVAEGIMSAPVDITPPTESGETGAQQQSKTMFGMANRITQLFPSLMNLIIGSAYISGLGFAVAAMVKLKAVKDNPQQNPVTMPLAFLAVSVLLVYMPSIISPTQETLFGKGTETEGGAVGQGYAKLIDSSTTATSPSAK